MKNFRSPIFLLIALVLMSNFAFGQMAKKPSASSQPAEQTSKKPDSDENSLPKITSREEFDLLARVYHKDTTFELPHVMFVIDRRAGNRIYYVNTQKYRYHKDFLYGRYLVPRGADVFKPVYIDQNRRFIVGTIAWQRAVEKFTWEMWEGDLASAELIRLAHETINKSFYEPVAYKPNSTRQEDVSAGLGIDRVLQSDISRNQDYLALNTGASVGRLHIIDKLDDTVEIGSNEIIVLNELPMSLPPVRGIIVTKPSTPLSHINILAKNWDIPNVYIKDADKLFREYDTWWVKLDADLTTYELKRLVDFKPEEKPEVPTDPKHVPPVNLEVKKLAPLGRMRARDSVIYGAKSANLGEMMNARIPGIIIPDGFSVPFYWYDKFIRDNDLQSTIEGFEYDNDFVHNPRYRRQRLEDFRAEILKGKFDPELRREIVRLWRTQLGGRPVFVRSSSNAEDLPNFSGAGLYSSVPNVRTEEKLIEAVKRVWASLWKFEAYEARVRNYVSQTDVYMSALIQVGIDMQKGGVMITKDPFDPSNKGAVYISSVCGHNSKVVENTGIPEQILVNPKSNSVVVLTLSQQESSLKFDPDGDLVETPDRCSNRQNRILTDLQARALARAALAIKRAFGGEKEQDIEWGIMNGRIYIVQARPYLDN